MLEVGTNFALNFFLRGRKMGKTQWTYTLSMANGLLWKLKIFISIPLSTQFRYHAGMLPFPIKAL